MPIRDYPITVGQQAALMTQPATSLENVPEGAFTVMRNWRRSKDQLLRMEGWVLFAPVTGGSQHVFDGSETVLRLAELRRPNGQKVVIGASRTQIKRFDTTTGLWSVIGSGYSAQGVRWQVESIGGTLILNNAVDLPVSYRVEDAAVKQVAELRQVGIASVDRIVEYNSFLFLLGFREVQANQLNAFMNGYAYAVGGTVAKNANFTVVTGDAGTQFNVTAGVSALVATLPSPTPVPNWYVWMKKMDAGGSLTINPLKTALGGPLVLTAINDLVLIWSDGTNYAYRVFAGGVIPASVPYGIVPTEITNHYPYGVAWGEFGEPTRWAPLFNVYMTSASTTLTLPFLTDVFIPGVTRVAVVGGGANGGTLGGQSDSLNGILVTAVSGTTITLEKTTDVSIAYPRTVQVTRWSDVSTLAGRAILQGDGSPIVAGEKLQGMLQIYRSTCIYTARYTGVAKAPFQFKEAWNTTNVPQYGDCVATINGDYHLFPGVGGRFYAYDGSSAPQIHGPTDNARDLFFSGLAITAECFVVENQLTKSWWFCRPGRVMCFDYEFSAVSELDSTIDAACFCDRPDSTDQWFILAIGPTVFTYGLVKGALPIATWKRNGVNPGAVMTTGLVSGGDPISEKDLLTITPMLASPSPDMQIQVSLGTTWNPSSPITQQMVPPEVLPSPEGENWIATFYREIFFQLSIELTDSRDLDCRLSQIQLSYDYLKGIGPVPRRNI